MKHAYTCLRTYAVYAHDGLEAPCRNAAGGQRSPRDATFLQWMGREGYGVNKRGRGILSRRGVGYSTRSPEQKGSLVVMVWVSADGAHTCRCDQCGA